MTDATYNSPCVNADGTPSPDTALTDPSQCEAAGLAANAAFLPGLLRIDLTRGGTIYGFEGSTDIKQEALFGQDFVKLGSFTADLGLRFDKYNGLARNHGVQPRMGLIYSVPQLGTSFHLDYSRVFVTPYNENLIVASSSGPVRCQRRWARRMRRFSIRGIATNSMWDLKPRSTAFR